LSKKPAFTSKPQASTSYSKAVVPANNGQLVTVMSNQYKLKLGGSVQVYQYKLEIVGMEMWDSALVQKITRFKRSALEKALGLYVCSGAAIYVLSELEEDVIFDVALGGAKYKILIEKSNQSIVQLDGKFENSDNSVSQNLINIIIK
jgi:hypothetical protein